MADGFIRLPVDDVGKRVDTDELTVAALTVQRERHRIAGAVDVAIAEVLNANPGVTDYGLSVREIGKTWKNFNVLAATLGDNIIVALVAGKRLKVYWFEIISEGVADQIVIWKSGAAVTKLGGVTLAQDESWRESLGPVAGAFVFATNAGENLVLNLSVAANVRVMGGYWDDDAS